MPLKLALLIQLDKFDFESLNFIFNLSISLISKVKLNDEHGKNERIINHHDKWMEFVIKIIEIIEIIDAMHF